MVEDALGRWSRPADEGVRRDLSEGYSRTVRTKVVLITVCAVLAVVSVLVAVGVGPVSIGISETVGIITDHLSGAGGGSVNDYFVWEGRMPRVLMGVLCGAGLAIGGCVMQSILNNGLADSYTTGISAGAGFGATIAFIAGITLTSGAYAVVVNAFVFSLIPTMVILAISRAKGGSPLVMVMSGIALMYIFNAVAAVFKIMADPNDLAALYAWQLGSIGGSTWDDAALVFAVLVPCALVLQLLTSRMNLLASGDDYARSMGVDVARMRNVCLLVVTVMTATIVSFTGLIGFVGLVAPHICRIFIGSDNRYLMTASALLGALLVVVADTVGRMAFQPYELQVGIITAFLGAPLFLYLIIRSRRTSW